MDRAPSELFPSTGLDELQAQEHYRLVHTQHPLGLDWRSMLAVSHYSRSRIFAFNDGDRAQLLLDASIQDDWGSLRGNPAKL